MPPIERAGYVLDWIPGRDPSGHPALVVIVKRTYQIDGVEARCKPAEKQPPPLLADELFDGDDPTKSSLRFESEVLPYKRAVDVILHGTGYAPGGRAVRTFDATARVGRIERSVRVVGPRKALWQPPKEEKREGKKVLVPQPPKFTHPEPIAKVPLRWENAYGGVSIYIPPDMDAYEALIEKQAKKAKDEKSEEEKAAEEKKAAAYATKKDKALKDFMGERPLEQRFSKGQLVEGEEPGGMMTEGGTVILSSAEIARAEAVELRRREAEEAERAAAEPKRDALGVILAEQVKDAGEYEAPERIRPEGEDEDRGTKVIQIAQMGDVVETDDGWVGEQIAEKEALGVESAPPEKRKLRDDLPQMFCPYNPVGRGFALGNHPETIDGLDLPLIEDPARPLTPEQLVREPHEIMDADGPAVAGLGIIGKGWYPRAKYVGVPPDQLESVQDRMDEYVCGLDPEDPEQRQMLENTLDYAPPVFDDRWYNAAHPLQQVPHLYGDEDVVLTNMTPEGTLYFRLPGDLPWVTVDRGSGVEVVRVRLDTAILLVDDMQAVLVWRGHVPYGGPDDLVDYPKLEFDIADRSLSEQRENDFHEAEQAAFAKKDGVTQIIDAKALAAAQAEDAARLKADAEALEKERGPKYLWNIEDGKGTRVQKETEPGDVLHADDGWIEQVKSASNAQAANAAVAAQMTEREARKKKKEALRDKIEEIKQREAEEAAAAAKKKKKPESSPS